MPTIRFNVTNPEMLVLDTKALRKELRAIGKEVARKTQALIMAHESSNPHKPSKPGEAPAGWTGNLAKLITVQVKKNKVTIKDTARYSLSLEAGAKLNNGSTVAPRPYLSQVLEQMTPEIEKRLERVIALSKEKQ